MTTRIYNHKNDVVDHRDWLFKDVHAPEAPISYPDKISLRDKFTFGVWDQGALGSCSAHAILACYTFEHGGGPWSRLDLYYQERLLEDSVNEDSGAMMRDGIKVLADSGVGLEEDWPYVISKFKEAPPEKEIQEASDNKIITYSSLQSADDYKTCLASGYPFAIGIQIFATFESDHVAAFGVVPMPTYGDQCLGGHAVTVIGYDSNFRGHGKAYYELRNSWGPQWGDHGYFWLPAEYLEDPRLASDAWTIRK